MRSSSITTNKIDWITVGVYMLLCLCGILNIYSSAYNPENPSIFDLSQEYGKQIMWWGISLVLGGMVLLLDGAFIRDIAYTAYGFSIALLMLVLLVGNEVNGAKAWFGIGGFGIQPSEFMKVTLSLALARYLSSADLRIIERSKRNTGIISGKISGLFTSIVKFFSSPQFYVMLLIGFPAALILLQPDMGTVIVFAGLLFMLYREGLSGNIMLFGVFALALAMVTLMLKDSTIELPVLGKHTAAKYGIILTLTIVTALGALFVSRVVMKRNRRFVLTALALVYVGSSGMVMTVDYAFHHVLGKHQKTRIDIFLGLKDDPNGEGYNIDRAMASIGSGGVTGKGYMKATLATKQQKHVPMQSTDFIYCTLSEEWGFLGSFAVIIAFVFLLIRIIVLAERQRLAFTRIFGYCVACIFFMHFLVNVGMAMGMVPVIGIPLPFFSYGGSSLMAFTLLLAIMIRLDAERMDVLR